MPPVTERAPTAPRERIEIIDVLRGFALFGVLVMNMQYFVHPSYETLLHSDGSGAADWLGYWCVRLLAESKFYPLFSFLFGYGMAMQIQSAAARGAPFAALYVWRLLILLLIGAYHSLYLWSGDILATYALLGFVLLGFRNASDRVLLAAGFGFLFAAPAILGSCLLAVQAGAIPTEWANAIGRGFEGADWGDRHAARQALRVMAMFFFGLWGGRRSLLTKVAQPKTAVVYALGLGLAGNVAYVFLREHADGRTLTWTWVAAIGTLAWAGPLLAAGYAGGVLELARHPKWRGRLRPLAPVGRTALTNYLLQTLICQPLMGPALLGRFGPVHPPLGILATLAVFGLQVIASNWWLRRFRFGPVEWLWRSLTYGRVQPLRA